MSGISTALPLKFDSAGNVLANLNAQNITPSATASNIKLDSNGNVLANLNAQNINPNINNPYSPELLSHQTGLSVTATASNTGYNIGNAISIIKNGIVKIIIAGHVSGSNPQGFIYLALMRGTNTYYFGGPSYSLTLFTNTSSSGIAALSPTLLTFTNTGDYTLNIPVLSGDSIQFLAGNNIAGDITYIDDMVVILQ